MAPISRYADYDAFAWLYNQAWGIYKQIPGPLDEQVIRHLPSRARILDLCCGTGRFAGLLAARGFQVSGLDGSEEMIRYARENSPGVEFVVADARDFRFQPVYHAAVSTFDSLNHVMNVEELGSVFACVAASLLPGGIFAFDLNMEQAFRERWRGSWGDVRDDHAFVIRSNYRPEEKIGEFRATVFRLDGGTWKRSDVRLTEKCFSEREVLSALETASFERARAVDPYLEAGRSLFVCRKPAES